MKAAFISRHGGPEAVEFGELPDPAPRPGEVLVQVKAASMNRLDLYTRAGLRGAKPSDGAFPHVLGGDCAGVVARLGEDVTGLAVGDQVVVNPLLSLTPAPQMLGTSRQGSHAELAAVPASNAVRLPANVSFKQAAALPTVFLPAWSALIEHAQLRPDETALVISASSGVGSAAIQVVKGVAGANCIAATSSGPKARAARELGADYAVNYEAEDLAARVREVTYGQGVDVVLDPTGARLFDAAFASLRPGGRYAVCGVTSGYKAELHLGQLFSKRLRLFGVYMGPTSLLEEIVRAVSRGLVRPVIHKTLPLSEARTAHEEMERSQHFGKFVLTMEG